MLLKGSHFCDSFFTFFVFRSSNSFLFGSCVCLFDLFVDLARAWFSFMSVCFIACMTVAGSLLVFFCVFSFEL